MQLAALMQGICSLIIYQFINITYIMCRLCIKVHPTHTCTYCKYCQYQRQAVGNSNLLPGVNVGMYYQVLQRMQYCFNSKLFCIFILSEKFLRILPFTDLEIVDLEWSFYVKICF